jgi:hypothetical protein
MKYFPDFRKLINEVQRYSTANGKIDLGVLSRSSDSNFVTLVGFLKTKDFANVRKWVVENTDYDAARFFRKLYDSFYEHMNQTSIPQAILVLADYQDKAIRGGDAEVVMMAVMVELMMLDWK